jgi:RNA polymerase sigma factor (sigma-70 family)
VSRPTRSARSIFDENFPWVFRYVDRMIGDAAAAADIAQETFVRLYRRREPPDDLRAWLATVAHNLVRDDRRRQARRARLLAARAPEHTMADPPPDPDARIGDADEGHAVRRALAALSEREQRLLLLRSEGLSYRELGLILALNEASVGTLLARARAAFQEALRAP